MSREDKLYSKIVKISLLFCVIVTLILSVYIFYFDSNSNSLNTLNENSATINNSKLIVEKSDKYCETKEDCVIISTTCSDCDCEVVNKESKQKLNDKLNAYCQENPPESMCDMMINGTVSCVNNKCVLS